MKPKQQGWLRELTVGKSLVMLVVFVLAVTGFLMLTDPSNAGRPTVQPAGKTHGGSSTGSSTQNASEGPSLPAASDVLPQRKAPSDNVAPTF
jgi:hypothetical protein